MTANHFEIPLSNRVLSVSPSITLAIAAKAKQMKAQGKDVVSLSAGEPDFDTPSYIKDAAIQALQKGVTKYTAVAGTDELRDAIAAKLKKDQGLTFTREQIVVGIGAKHAIFNCLFALLNEGDEVVIPAPFWLSYPEMVSVLGGKSKILQTDESTQFKLTPAILEKGLSSESKILILNSPSNPTGALYSKEELIALIQVIKKFPKLVLLSDEIYEKLIFDGKSFYSIASLDSEIAKRTIIINGLSKAYSMTGWRLGYAACPSAALAKAVSSIQSHSTSNPTSFAQAGGVVALQKGDADAKKMCEAFEKRRNYFYEKLRELPNLKPFRPDGAFYMFVNIEKTGLGSVEFCEKLLNEALVAAVPCGPFGNDKYVRMSFACSQETLEEAIKRLALWLKSK